MIKECMITTTDNPYSPFDEFDEWYTFDTAMGYNTCSLLARIAPIKSITLTEEEEEAEKEKAIDILCEFNFTGKYKKVFKFLEDFEEKFSKF